MLLRPFQDDDWQAVCEVYDLGKPDELRGVLDPQSLLPLADDEAMNALFRASRIVVAEDDSRVAGFAGHRGSFITWLFVHPAFRRRGIASALVRHLIGELEWPVTLNVVSENVPARALYARLGFKVERELRGNFQGWPCNVCKLSYGTAA
jgi:ribosomal protein S18 acetylase RimI-like enzyme